MPALNRTVGDVLRRWRAQRGLSQLALAVDTAISQRHLSFVESGRAQPSRALLLRLAEHLDVPLRDRNVLLLAAGYAPRFAETPFSDPALDAARIAIERILKAHEPYPAVTVDRHWSLLASNRAVPVLLATVSDADLLKPPVNVLRLTLHPRGLAPAILNLDEWRTHLLGRVRRHIASTGDEVLSALAAELATYGAASMEIPNDASELAGIAVPLTLRTPSGVLSFISTTTMFGAPKDVTLAEVALEAFFPENEATAQALRTLLIVATE